jgi:steroid delta-isomerase-like uncharacterized protein
VSETNKALLRRYIERYNARDWEGLRALLIDDYVHHSNADELTADQFVRGAEWIMAGIPDFTIELLDLVAEGDRVAARYVGTGTHAASMLGETPTSKRIALNGITVFRFVDGRIAEDWEAIDYDDLSKQIGPTSG